MTRITVTLDSYSLTAQVAMGSVRWPEMNIASSRRARQERSANPANRHR